MNILRLDGTVVLVVNASDLHEADLHGADLHEADLHGANLHGANLHGANLHWANLHWADLHGADLHGADLHEADLSGADLHGADLHVADLHGADLHGADLHEADLSGTHGVIDGGIPNGWYAWAWKSRSSGVVVRVGCREFSVSRARAYWRGKKNRREVLAAVAYIAAVARIRGWVKGAK